MDKIAPGTANDDTLLHGVEVKFYNMEVEIDENLESRYKGLSSPAPYQIAEPLDDHAAAEHIRQPCDALTITVAVLDRYKGLYIIGDGSGVTHSLSHASASGVYVVATNSAKFVLSV